MDVNRVNIWVMIDESIANNFVAIPEMQQIGCMLKERRVLYRPWIH